MVCQTISLWNSDSNVLDLFSRTEYSFDDLQGMPF